VRNYCIFLKKELIESAKTFKLLIMGLVFLVFGMLSPLTAKFTPEILKWAIESDSTIDESLAAMIAEVPPPTAFDSWVEFFSNIGLMGVIVFVIVFSGMIASELKAGSTGTLTIILTKGISRASVLLSKLTSAVLIWTGSLAVSALTCWGYTAYLFKGESVSNLLFGMFCLWLFGVFLISLTALFAALTKKGYICMMLVGAVFVVLNIVNIIPKIIKYNPASLTSAGLATLGDSMEISEVYPVLIVTGVCTVVLIGAAVAVFDRRKL